MSDFYLNPNQDNETIIRNIGREIRSLDKSKRWHITAKLFKKKRSNDQNAYYWGPFLGTIKTWYLESRGIVVSEDALHDEFKEHFVPYVDEVGTNGQERRIYKSTTKLSTVEFNEMFEVIASVYSEKGCRIPAPDPNWKKNIRKPKVESKAA